MDLADGVDDDTWLYHWKRGEISDWVRTCIKDEPVAEKIAALEREVPDDADESRERVRELIEEIYTLPAEAGPVGAFLRRPEVASRRSCEYGHRRA